MLIIYRRKNRSINTLILGGNHINADCSNSVLTTERGGGRTTIYIEQREGEEGILMETHNYFIIPKI